MSKEFFCAHDRKKTLALYAKFKRALVNAQERRRNGRLIGNLQEYVRSFTISPASLLQCGVCLSLYMLIVFMSANIAYMVVAFRVLFFWQRQDFPYPVNGSFNWMLDPQLMCPFHRELETRSVCTSSAALQILLPRSNNRPIISYTLYLGPQRW